MELATEVFLNAIIEDAHEILKHLEQRPQLAQSKDLRTELQRIEDDLDSIRIETEDDNSEVYA